MTQPGKVSSNLRAGVSHRKVEEEDFYQTEQHRSHTSLQKPHFFSTRFCPCSLKCDWLGHFGVKGEHNTKRNFLGLNSLIRPFPHLNTLLTARCLGPFPHGNSWLIPIPKPTSQGQRYNPYLCSPLGTSPGVSADPSHHSLPHHTALWAFVSGNLTPALGHSLEIFAPFLGLAPQQGHTVLCRAGLLTHILTKVFISLPIHSWKTQLCFLSCPV